jgi:hypothetical protein
MPSRTFEPALQLNAGFYSDVVVPLLTEVPHAAGLLGWGSDVLGYDTDRSTDHGWGPRLLVFVDRDRIDEVRGRIDAGLPDSYRGWPVIYGWDNAAPEHRVEVIDLGQWLINQLGVDPRPGLTAVDWLTIPQQQVLGVVRGAGYADPGGELASVRRQLAWFPREVHLWLLACQWQRISQEIAFVGRAAEVDDELGSRLIAGRLVQELMRLMFLQQRTYWPYSKWFGTAFDGLPGADRLAPTLAAATSARTYPDREAALVQAYEQVATAQNDLADALGTERVDWSIDSYFGRPYRVLHGRFAEACQTAIDDDDLRALPLVGSIDQFVDSTDVLAASGRSRAMQGFFERLWARPATLQQ